MLYNGAYPNALPPVKPAELPADPYGTTDVYVLVAFFQDKARNGVYTFYQDSGGGGWTKDDSRAAKQKGFKVLLSLNGDSWGWQTPADSDTWAKNAAASLASLMTAHAADGIDLNIENTGSSSTGWQGFADVMCDVISRLHAAKPQTSVSIAPFQWIDDQAYVPLWKQCGDKIDFINYQAYAASDDQAARNLLLGTVRQKYSLQVRRPVR